MIEKLEGLHETVAFKNDSLIKFYDNTDFESYPLHWHNSIEIIMPVENSYTVISNQVAYHLRPGDVLIIQSNVLHRMPAVHGRRFICQASLLPIFSLKMFKALYALLPATLLLVPEGDEEQLCAKVAELLHQIHYEYDTSNQIGELAMYTSILQILALVGQAASNRALQPEERENQSNAYNFMAICDYISQHSAERLTLEEVAKISGYSKFHFDRLFKKYTNATFYQYLNKLRIQHAEQLLRDYDLSITDAAYRCGFSSISCFIRMFKIYHQCTPSEYRTMSGKMG